LAASTGRRPGVIEQGLSSLPRAPEKAGMSLHGTAIVVSPVRLPRKPKLKLCVLASNSGPFPWIIAKGPLALERGYHILNCSFRLRS